MTWLMEILISERTRRKVPEMVKSQIINTKSVNIIRMYGRAYTNKSRKQIDKFLTNAC